MTAKGNRPTGGYVAKGELKLPDGSKIEFDGELKYGAKDAALSPQARQAVEAWENKRRKNKIEYAYSVYDDGTPVGKEYKGGKGSVRSPRTYHGEGTTFTHVHPRGDGILGGTFSEGDLRNFANNRGGTERAAAKEGTYSISKTAKFDKQGFLSYVRDCNARIDATATAQCKDVTRQAREGIITVADARKQLAKVNNNMLVALHNAYMAGQKHYGYTYTLEQ